MPGKKTAKFRTTTISVIDNCCIFAYLKNLFLTLARLFTKKKMIIILSVVMSMVFGTVALYFIISNYAGEIL